MSATSSTILVNSIELVKQLEDIGNEEDDEEDDLAPLEYARLNGLSRHHFHESLDSQHLEALQKAALGSLTADSHLPKFSFATEPQTEERLTLSKEAAHLLQIVKKEESLEDIEKLTFTMLGSKYVKNMKVELPLLKSDHESDCREFARWEGFEIMLKDVKLPLEMVDAEKDEALTFPSGFSRLGADFIEKMKQDKLEVTRDAFVFLRECVRSVWTREDGEELWESERKYKRNKALEPVTPPLFPMSPPLHPYEPSSSSPVFQLPLLSDPPSLINEDLQSIENVLFEQDLPTPIRQANMDFYNNTSTDTYLGNEQTTLAALYPSLASFSEALTPPSLETERIKREDLKIEETLTPTRSAVETTKTVRFSDFIDERVFETTEEELDIDELFQDCLSEESKKANLLVQQETLIHADTISRVEVRAMDILVPNPPWKKFQLCKNSGELLKMQKGVMNTVASQNPQLWNGASQMNLKLPWTPFPRELAKVALEETIGTDDKHWQGIVKDSRDDDVIDSSALAWKPPGLRILRSEEEEDEDELEPGKFTKGQPQDMSFLVKKRKMELDLAKANDKRFWQGSDTMADLPTTQGLRTTVSRSNHLMSAVQNLKTDLSQESELLLGGEFSAEKLLENFLELRGAKKPKLMDSVYFSANAVKDQLPVPTRSPSTTPQQLASTELPIRLSPVPKPVLIPGPPLKFSDGRISIIVSSTLFKHRALVKNLKSLLSLQMVERDFTAHNTTAWIRGSATRSPVASPLDSEVDIIISPSTGLILTTLQVIRQQPLPGQKTKPAIRDRLEKVSIRYERLIVLITEGQSEETTFGLDDNSCRAIVEFMGFSSGLETTVIVRFVGGGEETFAKWIASSIILYRVNEDETGELLEEESHWELFLRRAGMNAFAAQVIIGALKASGGFEEKSPSKANQFGLTAFVEMAREQRIAKFGGLCGRRMLERVSSVIDACWV